MRFNSEIDWWFWAIIVFVIAILGYSSDSVFKAGDSIGFIVIGFASVVGLGLPIWLALGTHYEVSDQVLTVLSLIHI